MDYVFKVKKSTCNSYVIHETWRTTVPKPTLYITGKQNVGYLSGILSFFRNFNSVLVEDTHHFSAFMINFGTFCSIQLMTQTSVETGLGFCLFCKIQ